MKELKKRVRLASDFFADEEEIEKTITTLEEQLSDELDTEDVPDAEGDTDVPVIEETETTDAEDDEITALKAEADALLASLEATKETQVPDEKTIISNECDQILAKIAEMEKETPVTASELKHGIEDEIGDEARGGDPSVSELPKTVIDCDTDKEVFPTNSEYVANITKRLDRVAGILEKRGMKRLAFRVDQLSDKLESSIK